MVELIGVVNNGLDSIDILERLVDVARYLVTVERDDHDHLVETDKDRNLNKE